MNNILVALISGFLILLGTLGAVLPFLPGLPLAWAGLLLYAWYTHFATVTITGLVVFAVVIALTMLVDIFAPALGASGAKASRFGIFGALLGAVLGVIFLGPFGILLGPFLGAYIGEMMHAANGERALKVAWGSMIGLIVGSVFKLIVGAGMFVYFIIKLF